MMCHPVVLYYYTLKTEMVMRAKFPKPCGRRHIKKPYRWSGSEEDRADYHLKNAPRSLDGLSAVVAGNAGWMLELEEGAGDADMMRGPEGMAE